MWFLMLCACTAGDPSTARSETDTDADADADTDTDTDSDTDADTDADTDSDTDDETADTSDTGGSAALVPANNTCGTASVTWFEDVTLCAGLGNAWHAAAPVTTSRWFVTGQAFGDVDGDGWLDLFVTGQALDNHLYMGRPDGVFVERTDPAIASIEGGAVNLVDVDNDGLKDLFVTGRFEDWLFRNDQGAFPGASPSGPGRPGMGMGGAWADLDGNGDLEVYITNYYCPDCDPLMPTAVDQSRDRLMFQAGGGFVDRTADLLSPGFEPGGMGFAAIWSDFDLDGDLDLYVVNDKGTPGFPSPDWVMNRNVFWRNDGPGCSGPCFTEIAIDNGTDLRIDSMGVDVADFDGDLDFDIVVSDTERVRLLRNDGAVFTDVSTSAGFGNVGITWGLTWLDADNDGWVDLFVSSGDQDHLYMNQQDGTFIDMAVSAGLADWRETYGVAAGDYDRDGRVDLLVGDVAWSYRLMRNQYQSSNHWVGLRLQGQGEGGPDAVGARVYLTDDSGRVQVREVHAGESLGSGNDLGVHFGVGSALPVEVRVVWPDGVETIEPAVPDLWSVVQR